MPLELASYIAPRSLEQLWEALQHPGPPPVLLSGGMSLLLRARIHQAPQDQPWVDLTTIPELCGIQQIEDVLWIGASTTYAQIAASPEIQAHAPALAMAAEQSGAWQVQNRSTIGGNATQGAAEADLLPALYALDAHLLTHDGKQERQLSCDEFYTKPHETALHEREILTGIVLPMEARQSVFLKIPTRTMRNAAKVSLALSLHIHNGHFSQVRFALGSVAPGVVRATSAEGLLEGQPIDHTPLLTRVADEVRRAASPSTDTRSTARYRKWTIGVLATKALTSIVETYQNEADATQPTPITTQPPILEPLGESS